MNLHNYKSYKVNIQKVQKDYHRQDSRGRIIKVKVQIMKKESVGTGSTIKWKENNNSDISNIKNVWKKFKNGIFSKIWNFVNI